MRKLAIFATMLGAMFLLLLVMPVVGRKCSVPLLCNGKVRATAKRPLLLPWKDNDVSVYVGKSNVFSVWVDLFDFPLFMYAFGDGHRFLCIYDYDTSVLVFVVDFSKSTANTTKAPEWPSDEYVRGVLFSGATNVVMNTTGLVRLPMYAELQEVSTNLTNLTPKQVEAVCFPAIDLGLSRHYWPQQKLLSALQTNRQACWP
jgi:hypothetical protein